MAWLAVDKDGTEVILREEPIRDSYDGEKAYSLKRNYYEYSSETFDHWEDFVFKDGRIALPEGTIYKLIGRNLEWKDRPVKLK